MYEPLKYLPVQSKTRQTPEPPEHEPTLEDICTKFEGIVLIYWLLGLCSQGAVIWSLVNIMKALGR